MAINSNNHNYDYNKLLIKTILGLLLLTKTNMVFSFTTDSLKVKKKKYALQLLPVAYYMPETRIGLGTLAYSVFRVNKKDTTSKKSIIQSYASYTQNKQFSIENEWQIFSKNEQYIFTGALDFTRFPEYFFGIGNFTNHQNKQLYTFDLFRIQSKNVYQFRKNTFVGFQYDMQYLYNVKKSDPMMMNPEKVLGSNGYFTSGIGALLIYDTRNYILNSTAGSYAEILLASNSNLTFSKYKYNTLVIDLRKYKTFFNKYTIALFGYGNFNSGHVPFRAMPYIGGARYIRGYYRGRYRDNNLAVLQMEARVHLFWRIGLAAFTGIGQVSNKFAYFKGSAFKYDYGIGLRYKINKKDNINLRIDTGFTNEGFGLYIVFAEAF
jgi:hypothetical protein